MKSTDKIQTLERLREFILHQEWLHAEILYGYGNELELQIWMEADEFKCDYTTTVRVNTEQTFDDFLNVVSSLPRNFEGSSIFPWGEHEDEYGDVLEISDEDEEDIRELFEISVKNQVSSWRKDSE